MVQKDSMHHKESGTYERKKEANDSIRKRYKVRKSDVDIGTDKFLVRFNT